MKQEDTGESPAAHNAAATAATVAMPPEAEALSHERTRRLEAWVKAHCPRAFNDPGFLPALVVIVEAEVRLELARACWKRLRLLGETCRR